MNQLQKVFQYQEHQVRTVIKDGEPWFVAKDVCDVLNHSNHKVAVSRLDKDEVSKVYLTDTLGRNQRTTVVNESGLYSLILTSNKPEAKAFKRWITHEVIPTIRKHGAYMTTEKIEEVLLNPDTIINLATQLKEERQKRIKAEQTIEIQKPKVIFAESVQASENSILIRELATILRQKGVEIGEKRLFAWLRKNGYLIKQKGDSYNLPTQRSMELGLFEIHKRTLTDPDGSIRITRTPRVTGKGQIYFVNKFLNNSKPGVLAL